MNRPSHHHGYALMAYLRIVSLRLVLILVGNPKVMARSELGEAGIQYATFKCSTQSARSPTNNRADSPGILARFPMGRKVEKDAISSCTIYYFA